MVNGQASKSLASYWPLTISPENGGEGKVRSQSKCSIHRETRLMERVASRMFSEWRRVDSPSEENIIARNQLIWGC